jgi:hypothetical protein
MIRALFFTLGLMLIVGNGLADSVDDYPVQWSPDLKLKSLADIPSFSVNQVIGAVEFSNDAKPVTTCHEFFEQRKLGHFPTNNAESIAESFFINSCVPLIYLARGKSAKISYIRNFNLQKDYGLLPAADILPNTGDGPQPIGDLINAYPDLHVNSSKPNQIDIESKKAGLRAVISIIARGDFDNNGYDEILVTVANSVDKESKGTYRTYSVYPFTRKEPNAPIIVAKQFWVNGDSY